MGTVASPLQQVWERLTLAQTGSPRRPWSLKGIRDPGGPLGWGSYRGSRKPAPGCPSTVGSGGRKSQLCRFRSLPHQPSGQITEMVVREGSRTDPKGVCSGQGWRAQKAGLDLCASRGAATAGLWVWGHLTAVWAPERAHLAGTPVLHLTQAPHGGPLHDEVGCPEGQPPLSQARNNRSRTDLFSAGSGTPPPAPAVTP